MDSLLERRVRALVVAGKHDEVMGILEQTMAAAFQQLGTLQVERDHYANEAKQLAKIVAWAIGEQGGELRIPIDELTVHETKLLTSEPDRDAGEVVLTLNEPLPEHTDA